MTVTLQGLGVSRGIAIGRAHLVERDLLDIPEYTLPPEAIPDEVQRFEEALAIAREQLRVIREHIPHTAAADISVFIDTYLLMLDDSTLTQEPIHLITTRYCNAEWALKLQHDALVAVFEKMDDPYLRTRRDDINHVIQRIQRILLNHGPLRHEIPDNRLRDYIILAEDMTPADTVLIKHHGVAAFVTEYGGQTSHTAILARSLGIPSVVGLQHFKRYIREDDWLIVDGNQGLVIINPDASTLAYYHRRQDEERAYYDELVKLKNAAAVTRDGQTINLQANVELLQDSEAVRKFGATGVGLYRTEFLFMNRIEPPSEEEHFEAYRELMQVLDYIPITIRTFDLGGDKPLQGGELRSGPIAANPALGLRAVRFSLHQPAWFYPQLRAIIRVSALGPVRLLIPMLSTLQELQQVLQMITAIQMEFRVAAVPFDPAMPVGGMIEVPAAAICADMFAQHLDFLSIGTNDLIQYTLAIDRVDNTVSYLYDPLHPGVLRLIRMVIEAGIRTAKPVSMCGEMAGDTSFVRLLLGLGLREFSVHPAVLLEVKRIINDSDIRSIEPIALQALKCSSGEEVHSLLEQLN